MDSIFFDSVRVCKMIVVAGGGVDMAAGMCFPANFSYVFYECDGGSHIENLLNAIFYCQYYGCHRVFDVISKIILLIHLLVRMC